MARQARRPPSRARIRSSPDCPARLHLRCQLKERCVAEAPKINIVITREDKPTGGRYVARVAGKPEAEMTFSKAGEKIVIIDHTGVPSELGGMGVGKAL